MYKVPRQETGVLRLFSFALVLLVRLAGLLHHRLAEFSLSKIPPHWKNFIATVHRDGIRIRLYTGESVGRRMYYFHDYETSQKDVFLSLLLPGGVLFDVGANIGIYSLLAAHNGMRVYAFEPSPELADFLIDNIKLNEYEQEVIVVKEAVSNRTGITTFFPPRKGNWGVGKIFTEKTDTVSGTKSLVSEPIQVPTITLDDAAKRYGKPDLIKVDIEGAEQLLLSVLPNLLMRHDAPMLFIEFHQTGIESLGGTVEKLIDNLRQSGYRQYKLNQSQSKKHDWYVFSKTGIPASLTRTLQEERV